MRAPTDLPRRRARSGRGRILLLVAAGVLFVLLVSLRGIAGFYTDYLWFDQLRLASVWRGILGAKLMLALVFSALFFVILWVNLLLADRMAPRFRPPGPEEELVERYREIVGHRTGLVRTVTSLLFALIAGVSTSSHWNDWILFRNRVDFGIDDPQFHKDIGYYVFELPFLKFLADWAFASLIIILIVTTVAHYLNGGIRVQVPAAQRVTPQVKAHISVLLGFLALVRAAQYWLDRYELNFSTRGVVKGASYTDVNAQLPALTLLVVISLIAFVLLLVNIRLRGWMLPIIAVGLWAFVSVVVGTAYPAFIQRVRVEPNESEREREFIARNIEATHAAMQIDDVDVKTFRYNEQLTADDLSANAETIRNVRLWDPLIARETYQQLQEIRRFYRFNDLDIDRYEIDGKITQVLLAARDLDPDGIPSASWENQHLVYTHGYGAVLAPTNASVDGRPNFLVKDIPPTGAPEVEQPGVYFGENLSSYAVVDTEREELDYQTEDKTQRVRYAGDGGVPMSSWVRRVAFALRFGDFNILTSGYFSEASKAIYIRDIHERVRKVAPFLKYDADPYPVIYDPDGNGNRMVWVQDAYTTTSRFPYAESASGDRLPPDSGLNTSLNYVRNSVKVVIDAYHGTMTFYVVDDDDPILRAYRKAFPDLFSSEDPPAELREHFRYPEDLFRVQTSAYRLYHITDPKEFFEETDEWEIPRDPGSGRVSAAGIAVSDAVRMNPYYLLMRLPEAREEEFLILQPFVPRERELLTSFLVAKSDPDEYGTLQSYVIPRSESVQGPTQVDAQINQDTEVSGLITLLNRAGSQVLQGNLLLIPVEHSLLWIRPLYVRGESTAVPELQRVIVVYGDQVVIRERLQDALNVLFGTAPPTQEGEVPPGEEEPPPEEGPDEPPVADDVAALLDEALAAYERAQAALRRGDLAGYQREIENAENLIRQARSATSGAAGDEEPSPTATTTTVPPATSTTSAAA